MAGKEIKKGAQMEAQKETPKKGRRLKRSVRKTLGAITLAAAIAVAAVPTENLRADEPGAGRAVTRTADSYTPSSKGIIPQFTKSDNIYMSGTGKFLFAFSQNGTNTSPTAVILGYDSSALGEGGELEIPAQVEPYIKFTNTLGGAETGYVVVGSMENFLYYRTTKQVPDTDENGEEKKDASGKTIMKTVTDQYLPCYASTKSQWENIPANQLYYDKKQVKAIPGQGRMDLTDDDVELAKDADYQPTIADVVYIGNQYLTQETDSEGKGTGIWHIDDYVTADNPEKGIFATNSNIQKLVISSDKVQGIGEYAFYNCSSLKSIELKDGLRIIAEGAFYGCYNMNSISIPVNSNLTAIGAKAFYYCEALSSFTLPVGVVTIGDSAFENCASLAKVDLLSDGQFNGLQNLGRDVFKGCRSLQNITFPNKVTGTIWLSAFQGCDQLHWISTRSDTITFKGEDDVFSYDDFKKMLAEGTTVDGTFYFEGFTDSTLNQMTKENCFAFSHIGYDESGAVVKKDRYELTVQEEEGQGAAGRATYEVNSSNQLTRYEAGSAVDSVTIPNHIGPNTIATINEGVFSDNCYIIKVEIPENVKVISANAFRGCHNLENVIFASGDVQIGANAFATQETKIHSKGVSCRVENDSDGSPKVKLKFIGPVSYNSGPFKYAMSTSGKYNTDTQTVSYITYLTGWPQNMEIRFNPDAVNPETGEKGMSELVDFPSLDELAVGLKYTSKNYIYISEVQESLAKSAIKKYRGEDKNPILQGEQAILDAALNIEIPEGVESVRAGLFKEKEKVDLNTKKTVKAYSLKAVTCKAESSVSGSDANAVLTGTFVGCEQLTKIELLGGVVAVDKYAFKDCTALTDMTLPATVKTMGIRPFAGCRKLSNINFLGGSFTCKDSIIFELADDGKIVVECLEGRVYPSVAAEELAGVSALYEEAFMMGASEVSKVDLSQSNVKVIPIKAFMDNAELREIVLPTIASGFIIREDAFTNCPKLNELTIPGMSAKISTEAFGGTTLSENKVLWFYCHADSEAADFADLNYPYIQWKETKPVRYWEVQFGYYDDKDNFVPIDKVQSVLEGTAAIPPENAKELIPKKEGYTWNGVDWIPASYLAVYDHLKVTPKFVPVGDERVTITYLYEDLSVYTTQTVDKGTDVIPVQAPVKPGYVYIGWRIYLGDGSVYTSLKNVQSNMSLLPVYKEAEAGEDDGTGATGSPGASGGPGGSGSPGASDGSGNGNGNGNGNGTSGTFYNLTVVNGSGSGSYLVGAQPVIIANDPASGQVFDHWTVSPADVKIASTVLSASIITMPASDVTVTAYYKASSGNGTAGGGGTGSTGSGNNNQRPNGTLESGKNGGTTVVIDKNGLSNTGVVSATINGSSDNFTIKITETAEANEAALRALMAEYGDNLDNIKYFPMDISLYDSTGTRKITDTSGLSISITLPLPDSLITYAGNNRVASTSGNKLERLSPRFSTIQGVSCITFTAEHFSPYVIYVNTRDLSSGLVSDDTPKTGDFIHPKWFLSIGLACLSFVLFMQKDTRKQKKVKVKVRA